MEQAGLEPTTNVCKTFILPVKLQSLFNPATGSPTATVLRLRPSCPSCIDILFISLKSKNESKNY